MEFSKPYIRAIKKYQNANRQVIHLLDDRSARKRFRRIKKWNKNQAKWMLISWKLDTRD